MFLSKIPQVLQTTVSRIFRESIFHNNTSYKFTSNVAALQESLCEQKGVPDKLYRKVEIEVKGNDPAVLKSYSQFVVTAAQHLNINVGRNMAPRKATHERWSLLKSAHIYKKHFVQYEIRTYFRYMDLLKLTGSTADTFLEYIQRNLPEGVAMKVTKVELNKLPESIDWPQSQAK